MEKTADVGLDRGIVMDFPHFTPPSGGVMPKTSVREDSGFSAAAGRKLFAVFAVVVILLTALAITLAIMYGKSDGDDGPGQRKFIIVTSSVKRCLVEK